MSYGFFPVLLSSISCSPHESSCSEKRWSLSRAVCATERHELILLLEIKNHIGLRQITASKEFRWIPDFYLVLLLQKTKLKVDDKSLSNRHKSQETQCISTLCLLTIVTSGPAGFCAQLGFVPRLFFYIVPSANVCLHCALAGKMPP